MNVVELSEAEAFKAGADLWILKNDSTNKWWKEIDFRSGFLLSHCLYHHRKPIANQISEILELTEFPNQHFFEDTDYLLVGTSDHFLNKWILVWNHDSLKMSDWLLNNLNNLKFNSIRFFSDSEVSIRQLKSSPKTSLTDVTFIKNT